ncbi:hypothetical protein RRG08_018126 [Elysia crispata]|uniref:Uncharacterized protein n=1 Tax=Elysia crispata TaxID=231223 RepID=A0AAE0ZVX9_9GAST|nr:hypothetical protein RRG08_018126 [Elysia crispata]
MPSVDQILDSSTEETLHSIRPDALELMMPGGKERQAGILWGVPGRSSEISGEFDYGISQREIPLCVPRTENLRRIYIDSVRRVATLSTAFKILFREMNVLWI